jgi:hypothetical protein
LSCSRSNDLLPNILRNIVAFDGIHNVLLINSTTKSINEIVLE